MLKQVILKFSLLCIISSCFIGCEKETGTSIPILSATVLKFKQPDYKNYVLANYLQDDDYIYAMRYNMYGNVGYTPYSPYWELQDNWLLVDWKWPNFPYNAGLTLLTEQTWDNFNIDSTTTSQIPKWPLSEPHIFNPLEAIKYIRIRNLAVYSNTPYDESFLDVILLKDDILKTYPDSQLYERRVEIRDSIWTLLQRDLSVAIKNGDLEHINDKKYNPY